MDFEIVAEGLGFPEGPVWMEDGSIKNHNEAAKADEADETTGIADVSPDLVGSAGDGDL